MSDSMPRELPVAVDAVTLTTALFYPAVSDVSARAALVLAHGAGAGQRHPFMVTVARGLARRGVDVLTFNFLYMEQKRRAPDRMPALVACFRAVMTTARQQVPSALERLFIGGKSLGARAATHVAADDPALSISGLVLLGYPLHPPGAPDKTRDAHLPAVKRPMLFVQGSRDAFGTPSELKPILGSLEPLPTLHTVHEGDHSFTLPGRGAAERQSAVFDEVAGTIVEWMAMR